MQNVTGIHFSERTFLGEAARTILDVYSGRKRPLIGDHSQNCKKLLVKKKPSAFLNKPQVCDYIKAKDFEHDSGPAPKQQDFDSFLENTKDV